MDGDTFDQILDSISQGVVIFGADRKISYCNQAFLDITGFDRADVAGALCHIMQGPETDPATIDAIDAALKGGAEFSGEILNYRKRGETFWNRLTFKPEFHPDGSVRHFIGISCDITPEKTAKIKAAHFEQEASQKSNALELISGHLSNAQRIARIGIFDYSVKEDLQYWSDELINMIGAPLDKFPAPSDLFVSRIDQSDRPRFDELFYAAVEKGIPYEITVKVHRHGGGTMYMQIIADVKDVGDDRRITGIARDVTEETTAAQLLAHERERFELAARATQDAIFEWDLETHEFWANEAYKTIYGYEPPKYINPENLEASGAAEADLDLVRQTTLDAISSGKQRYTLDYKFRRADGQTGHAAVRAFIVRDARGDAQRIIGTTTDVGQLTRATAALEQSEKRFRLIADSASDVLWDYDFESGFTWSSPDWPSKLGIEFDPRNVQDFQWVEMVEPSDRERLIASFQCAIKSDASTWETEFKAHSAAGHQFDLAIKASILRHPDGRASRMLGTMRNVTQEKRNQEGYTRARALEAVGQLTGGVAHDFNNLLMIILGNVELLETSNLGEEGAETVASIGQAAESAARLTRQLLTFARQAQLNRTRVNVNALVSDTMPLLRAGLPETISFSQSVSPDLWPVDVDENSLQQAIVNLAMNANDAMPRGGKIVVTCSNVSVDEDMVPAKVDIRPGRYVTISVSDSGEGMPAEVLARAFEPFFTTKDVGKGTGLGLSTVYGFAKQSGGGVAVYSELGRGTTVNLYLPAAEGDVSQSDHDEPAIEAAMPSRRKKILVVEDQPQVRTHVERTLARLGYTVATAQDAAAALATLKHGEEFDLLFTDIIMPGGMNGQELADEALKIAPQLKILYTSGYPAAAFEHLGLKEQSSINFLSKPYKAADLQRMLAEIFDNQSQVEGDFST